MKKKLNRSTLEKLLRYVGNYRGLLILSLLLAAIVVLCSLYLPVLFGNAIDQIIDTRRVYFADIRHDLLIAIVVLATQSLASWIMNLVNNRVIYHTVEKMRDDALKKIQTLPLSFIDSHNTGDIVDRVIADVDQISDGLLLGVSQLFSGILTIVATLVFMLQKSGWVTLLVVVLTPVSFLVARYIAQHTYTMFTRQNEARGKETALLEEMIGCAKTVKAFEYEQRAGERFRKINNQLGEYSQKATFYSSLTNPATRAVNAVIYALVALLGSYLILAGRLTVGGLSTLLTYANQYMKPFNDISSVVTEMQNALTCAERVFYLLEQEPEVKEKSQELTDVRGNVQLDHVFFSYTADHPLIRDLDLQVKPGQKIALVGPTGCGKTTIINLLMRFYDVQKGSIRIEETDIRDVTRHSLREHFGMVLQDTWLMQASVRDNLRFGKRDASDEEIIEACKKAHSWEFIRRLPQKLDTMLYEDTLSAGEKQLLCITRVLLNQPQMLILDEATSSIDTLTELNVQKAFDALMEGKTSFIVAHRLSTIRSADLILVMRDGMILERGTHDELMRQNGFYKDLYNSQFVPVEIRKNA